MKAERIAPAKTKPVKVALTKARIAALPVPTKGRTYTYDARTPGLCVCVTATGTRTFYLYRWLNGSPQRLRIGRSPDLSVEQARAEAQKLTGDMAKGINPQDAKRAIRREWNFGAVFADYMERYAKPYKKSWRHDQAQYDRYLKPLAGRKVSAIMRADVQRLHAHVGQAHGKYAANRAMALLSTVYNRCAADVLNPARGVKRFKEQSRPDSLSLKKWGASSRRSRTNPRTTGATSSPWRS